MPELTQPIEQHPHEIVENVYPLPVQPNDPDQQPKPDYVSTERMEAFLIDRFRPQSRFRRAHRVAVEGETVLIPGLARNGWLITPRNALIASLVLTGAANVIANIDDIATAGEDGIEVIQGVKDSIEDHFHIGEVCKPGEAESTTKETTKQRVEKFVSLQSVGSSEPNLAEVDELLATIANAKSQDTKAELTFVFLASDDYRGDDDNVGFEHPNPENADVLAPARALKFMQAVNAVAAERGIDISGAKIEAKEVVLKPEELKEITDAIIEANNGIAEEGVGSLEYFLSTYNIFPDSLDSRVKDVFDKHIGSKRGLQATIDFETTTVTVNPGKPEEICEPDGDPNENHDYDLTGLIVPIPPLPRFRKKMYEYVRKQYVDVPAEMPEPEFLKLYPEAKTATDELVAEAWVYARKYQDLFREDDRIQDTYQLEYTDDNGDRKSLNAIFIDHKPTERSKEMIKDLFRNVSQLQAGRVGSELNMVAIYPSENAGTRHQNPKKVGLGLDIQRESGILGLAYGSFGLVEMHMPTDPTEEEMQDRMGPLWVAAHEIAGHFTDLNNEKNKLMSTGEAWGHKVYFTNGRFADKAQSDYDRVTAEERGQDTRTFWQKLLRRPYDTDLKWDIKRGTQMVNGQIEPRVENVKTTDPRLTEAVFARIGRFMSQYARTNAAEHWAEAAANILTGIRASFSEEPEARANRVQGRNGYAQGYNASKSMHKLITADWGSNPDADFVEFSPESAARRQWTDVFVPLNESHLYPIAEKARNTPVPSEEDLLWIFTGTRI